MIDIFNVSIDDMQDMTEKYEYFSNNLWQFLRNIYQIFIL